jgi:predicted RNA-binding Zn-ribbon protein involved in translation (DUF1610 family)
MIQVLMMTYMEAYNNNTENERDNLSFSFSDKTKVVSVETLSYTVKESLQRILNERHSYGEKRIIDPKHERLNFACPYCGDSTHDHYKKRGNIYLTKGFYFKCYNCGKYRDIEGFMKDFQQPLAADEIVLARELTSKLTSSVKGIDPTMFLDVEGLKKWAIDRKVIEEKNKLVQIDKSSIYVYLVKRLQSDMNRFAWDPEKEQLYIFHLIPETTLVLGYQIRNFKYKPKYMTWKLSKIYEDYGYDIPQEVYDIDDISTTFGILELDLSQPVTVFEGPLDSFLFRNSAGTCSSNIDFPIDLGSLRYLYDYDDAGKKAAMAKIERGRPVFLWRKLLRDLGISIEGNKKMDLTELLVYCKRKDIKLPALSGYFSQSKYDIYDI